MLKLDQFEFGASKAFMSKKMSITDIAKMAGVSVSTVSRSLQDSPLISNKTKTLVKKIATENNFRINTRARNLRTQKSQVIGLLCNMNHAEKQETSDQFLFSLVNSISAALHLHDNDLLLHTAPAVTAELASSYVYNQKVDGVIIVGQGRNQHEEIIKLADTGIPFVVWGGFADEQYITVGGDNFRGGWLAADHLARTGKHNILFLGPHQHLEISHRYQGYLKALKDHGLTPPQQALERPAFCIESGYQVTEHLLSEGISFDGLVCASDTIALGAIKCLTSHGIELPKQVGVVGFDDISFAKDWSPKLTTIRQDTTLAGKLLVEKLLQKIDGNKVDSVQIDLELIVRESA